MKPAPRHSRRRIAFRLWTACAVVNSAGASITTAAPPDTLPPDAPPPDKAKPGGRVVQFAPGVEIDWANELVSVDAMVVLREGALELLACSPRSREHESILVVPARPLHIHQAMGLIGLTPGSPVRFDERTKSWSPPTGARLRIDVEYAVEGKTHFVPVERWLWDHQHQRVPKDVAWVFTGSRTMSDGRYVADLDGTIICVVDFDTALIAINSLHSADNEHLWLGTNTKVIPPRGTRCKLRIRAHTPVGFAVRLTADGRLVRGDREFSPADLLRRVKFGEGDSKSRRVVIERATGVSDATLEKAVGRLVRVGIERKSIEIAAPSPQPKAKRAEKDKDGG